MELYRATPTNIPPERFEVYGVALALVVQAFLSKKPHLLQDADNLFRQLQQTNLAAVGDTLSIYAPEGNHEVDFALERGLCSLLVGKLDECRLWLGLFGDNSPYRNPSIADFVLENSNADDDSDLPGLCKLLETWLSEVVFPRFRDTKDIQFKLGDYYDDPTVLRYLERLEGNDVSPLDAAAAIVKIGAAEATAVLDHVKVSAIQALQKVFPPGQRDGSVICQDGERGQSFPLVEREDPIRKSDQGSSDIVDEISGSSTDQNIKKMLNDEKSRDNGVKIISAGVLIGLVAFLGLRFWPSRHRSSVPREGAALATTSNVVSVGMIRLLLFCLRHPLVLTCISWLVVYKSLCA